LRCRFHPATSPLPFRRLNVAKVEQGVHPQRPCIGIAGVAPIEIIQIGDGSTWAAVCARLMDEL